MHILHVLRSPVGGLFRHVRDLAIEQSKMGVKVGVIASDERGDAGTAQAFENLVPHLALGLHRLPIAKLPHPQDFHAVRAVRQLARETSATIVHGHGAKGGLLARLSATASVYTPHGGSLHYAWQNPAGALFLATEKFLVPKTGGFVFVCEFERRAFDRKIGLGNRPSCVTLNGLQPPDFIPVAPNDNATDLLFVGEMRSIKGVDILLHAICQSPRRISATFVGDGGEREKFMALARQLQISDRVNFVGRLPFRDALKLGHHLVLPSRNEALPYVVLEFVAAGRVIIASDVGGISEVLTEKFLVPSCNVSALSARINDVLLAPGNYIAAIDAIHLKTRDNLTVSRMAESSIRFYETIARSDNL